MHILDCEADTRMSDDIESIKGKTVREARADTWSGDGAGLLPPADITIIFTDGTTLEILAENWRLKE